MRKKINVLLSILALVCLIGCATGPNAYETDAYKTLAATAQTVDAARQAWNDYVKAGHSNVAEVTQVHSAYVDYQAAMAAAQVAVAIYHANPTNSLSLETALANFGTTAGNVISEIATLKK